MRMFVLPASTALAIVTAAAGYAWLGAGADARDQAVRSLASEPVAELPAPPRTADQPADAAGWQTLARSYAAQGQHAQAVVAFRNAARLRPEDATLLTEYAFSAAVTERRSSVDEPQRLVERALQLDPDSLQALALAGTLALDRSDFDAATQHWERLAQLEPPGSPMAREVQASIAQARRLAAGRIELARAH